MLEYLHRTGLDVYQLHSTGGAAGHISQLQNEVEKLLHGNNTYDYYNHLKERATVRLHNKQSSWLQSVISEQHVKVSSCLGSNDESRCSWTTPIVCSTTTSRYNGVTVQGLQGVTGGYVCDGTLQLVQGHVNGTLGAHTTWDLDKMYLAQNYPFVPKPVAPASVTDGLYLENMADSSVAAAEWVKNTDNVGRGRSSYLHLATVPMEQCPPVFPRTYASRSQHEMRAGSMSCQSLSLSRTLANYNALDVSLLYQRDQSSDSKGLCPNVQAVLTYNELTLSGYGPQLWLRFNGFRDWFVVLASFDTLQSSQPIYLVPGTDEYGTYAAFRASATCILDCYNAAKSKDTSAIQSCLLGCSPGGNLQPQYNTSLTLAGAFPADSSPIGIHYPVRAAVLGFPSNICHNDTTITYPGGPQPADADWWDSITTTKMPHPNYCWKNDSFTTVRDEGYVSQATFLVSKLLGQNASDLGIDLPEIQVIDDNLETQWLQLLQTVILAGATTLFGLWMTDSSGRVDAISAVLTMGHLRGKLLKALIMVAIVLVTAIYNAAAMALLVRTIKSSHSGSSTSQAFVAETQGPYEPHILEVLTVTEVKQKAWPGYVMLVLYVLLLLVVLCQALYKNSITRWSDRLRFMESLEYRPYSELVREYKAPSRVLRTRSAKKETRRVLRPESRSFRRLATFVRSCGKKGLESSIENPRVEGDAKSVAHAFEVCQRTSNAPHGDLYPYA